MLFDIKASSERFLQTENRQEGKSIQRGKYEKNSSVIMRLHALPVGVR